MSVAQTWWPLDRQTAQQIRIYLVPSRGLGRVGPAIQRLDAHAPHHRPADHDTLATQQVAQHPAARERVVQMQRIDPPHNRKLGRRHRLRFIIAHAPAEPQQRCLPHRRQLVVSVDRRFALSRPALLGAPASTSFSSGTAPILA
jgi:hypothetical protein